MKHGFLPTNGQDFDPLKHMDFNQCTMTIDSWPTNLGMRNYATEDWSLIREDIRNVPLWHCFWRVDLALGNETWKGSWYQDITPIAPSPTFNIPPPSLERWIPENDNGYIEPFYCGECQETFQSAGTPIRHYRQHHCDTNDVSEHAMGVKTAPRPKNHKCDKCGNTFRGPQRLAEHMNVHLGLNPFVCDNCGKGFATSDPLQKHKIPKRARVPPLPKPSQCDGCGIGFSTKKTLWPH
ncbi:hypothetical protein V8C34DRAFT_327340 [Trichoderma compactum]